MGMCEIILLFLEIIPNWRYEEWEEWNHRHVKFEVQMKEEK